MGDSEAFVGWSIILGILLTIGSILYGFITEPSLNAATGVTIGVVLVSLGVWAAQPEQQWYCSACGQKLGRGEKPTHCQRCGSNRSTRKDPGAGQKFRVDIEENNRHR